MLKPIRKEATRVADGRRMAARSIVITSLSAVDCHVFRRYVEPVNQQEDRYATVYPGAEVLSSQEEHATRYEEQGYAKILFEHFVGGSMWSDGSGINIGEATIRAQVEPFHIEDYESIRQMQRNVPDWTPQKGDIFGLIIDENTVKWLECLGSTGQTLQGNHGEVYSFNVRDSLEHLEPFISQEELLKPAVNNYPVQLNELVYSSTPIFNVDTNGTESISDDELSVRKFKLITPYDPELQSNTTVVSLRSMSDLTQSPYSLTESDSKLITVNLGEGETFILSSSEPVRAITANNKKISYFLIATDHNSLVDLIDKDLKANKPVKVQQGEIRSYDLLPGNFDSVRKMYNFVIMAYLGEVNTYQLSLSEGQAYSFAIDLTHLEGV
ncbi:TPA: hypothetical protein LUJ82_003220 [Acinetobacter baumannii]|jgi:hypothetical protein|uniref:hypothetical protein n=1 Tax=Acinetobacter TaxID=469 RepID=UPI0002CE89F7|nr:hypothetical protein [Acinetobacter baumannii]EKT7934293.1 hypothetical protein [Acinetobacter baumannii]EKT8682795.1 hypothetical protein [Acinetobacter baumannii]EKT9124192.1 hypothetical protein [Acinetobacter baumannii]EKU3010411.1 hypothetical protein [Acinetobacter baumannii]EKU3487871.1 hypothetical protein [Acinetobacter baumannii]